MGESRDGLSNCPIPNENASHSWISSTEFNSLQHYFQSDWRTASKFIKLRKQEFQVSRCYAEIITTQFLHGAWETNSSTNRKNDSSKGQEQATKHAYHIIRVLSSDSFFWFCKGLVISEAARLSLALAWSSSLLSLLGGNIQLRL